MMLSNNGAIAVAILLSYAGWGTLSMTMDRHSHEAFRASSAMHDGHPPAMWTLWTLRTVATLGLLLSMFALVMVWGAPIGLVAWCGVLTLSCVFLALQLHYASRTLRFTVTLAALGATLIALLAQIAAQGAGTEA